ncbi:MAG: hypothetical protein A3F11_00435 [Gammaproteobacteria bacterium RIFCSPHIGHO2_12_FULL_37_14]|nr:MAG: hypothetical protein A3F11_00435 [Gammaproteobacteria bacterium RIFCSPHIGHO2_12_FULL_37_14]
MLSLADAILQEDDQTVNQLIYYGEELNQIDEYGFTPLIEAAIANNLKLSKLLLEHGANPNLPDATGGSALHWAAENNNIELCQLLLKHGANPNSYNFAGQPVLVMPMLRGQKKLRHVLVQAGADPIFSQDYINVKLLGHLYELIGTTNIVDNKNQFVEVDFEGFYLEVTIGLIADSLTQFQNHFAARQLRRYSGLARLIVEVMRNASQLIKYQQYQVDTSKYKTQINSLLQHEPLLIPVGYEGHAITFIHYGDIWVKCDRREDSRLYDNIMFYQVKHPKRLSNEFFKKIIYTKQTSQFINEEIDQFLGLVPLTELKVDSQISGNCSWANVEATIPILFFLILMQMNKNDQAIAYYKTLALNFFHRWREWNKDRTLNFCIQSYEEGDAIRKACKAEILATILFQRCDSHHLADRKRIETILSVLVKSPYEYLLKNYLRVFFYESRTEAGQRFAAMLREYEYLP